MQKRSIYRLTIDALLSAICFVLGGYLKIDAGIFKITFEAFPVLLAAMMYGPADGALVGLIGTFLYQMLAYPLSATTALWILPYVIMGGVVGFYAKRCGYRNTPRQIRFSVIASELIVFVLNTFVIYADASIYGYTEDPLVYVLGNLWIRAIILVAKSIALAAFTPKLLVKLSRFTGNGRLTRPE